MTSKTEDRFYFGKPEQKTKFGSDTRAVNRQARMWLSQANNAGADEGLEQFHARLIKRLAEIIQSTDELIRNPKKEEDYGGWSYDDLEKELLSVAPHSNVARRWLQSNLRGGRFSRPGQPERFGESLQAKWDGKQYRVLTPSGAAWYSDDGKRWTLKHGEPVPSSEVRKYDIKLGTGFSRPGQPERFDASSLDRGNFAEASKSPMLGKLLSAKVMPEGGWRAVQVGSDTLVISV